MNTPITINQNWQMRSPSWDDLDAVNDLYNRYMQDVLGINPSTPETLRANWTFPNLSMEDDFRVVFDENDKPIAYASVWNHSEPHTHAWINLLVDPLYKENEDLYAYLLAWLEQRARATLQKAPVDAKLSFSTEAYTHQNELIHRLTEAGYVKSRNFWTMKIDLDQAVPEPQFPDGITLSTYAEQQDVIALNHAVNDAFRDHWGHVESPLETELEKWAHWTDVDKNPDYDPTMWFLAMDGDEIAAMSLCTPHTREDMTMGYVYTLGVRRPWRRQGLALALLQFSFREMQARGLKSCSLDVDAQSLTGATRLYERAGMHVWRQSADYEKVVRDGVDYRTQEIED